MITCTHSNNFLSSIDISVAFIKARLFIHSNYNWFCVVRHCQTSLLEVSFHNWACALCFIFHVLFNHTFAWSDSVTEIVLVLIPPLNILKFKSCDKFNTHNQLHCINYDHTLMSTLGIIFWNVDLSYWGWFTQTYQTPWLRACNIWSLDPTRSDPDNLYSGWNLFWSRQNETRVTQIMWMTRPTYNASQGYSLHSCLQI